MIGLDEFDQLKRPAEILGLIRTASRSDAVILGSASHRAVRFALANICWIAGIHVSLDDEADVSGLSASTTESRRAKEVGIQAARRPGTRIAQAAHIRDCNRQGKGSGRSFGDAVRAKRSPQNVE